MSSPCSSVMSRARSLPLGSAAGPPSIMTRWSLYSTRSPAGAKRGEFIAPTPSKVRRTTSGFLRVLTVDSAFNRSALLRSPPARSHAGLFARVLAAFLAEAERATADLRRELVRACRESDFEDAAWRPSRFKALVVARDLFAE